MKFETYKAENGEFRWRLREANGRVVSVTPGKIKGLDTSPAKKKTSERVVGLSLQRLAGNGKSDEKRTRRGGRKTAKA